jgi:hypothetical protein
VHPDFMHIFNIINIDNIKDSFYEELDKCPMYHMNILLGDFNAKADGEHFYKAIIEIESSHETTKLRHI